MGLYVRRDATRMAKDLKPSLVMADGTGIVDRDQETQEGWRGVLKYLKGCRIEKMVSLFCQRSTVKLFSVCNAEIDGARYSL